MSFCLSFDESPTEEEEDDDDEPEEEFLAERTGEKHVVGGDGGLLRLSESSLPLALLDSPNPRSNSCCCGFISSVEVPPRFLTLYKRIKHLSQSVMSLRCKKEIFNEIQQGNCFKAIAMQWVKNLIIMKAFFYYI